MLWIVETKLPPQLNYTATRNLYRHSRGLAAAAVNSANLLVSHDTNISCSADNCDQNIATKHGAKIMTCFLIVASSELSQA